jgi:hypothetical protein
MRFELRKKKDSLGYESDALIKIADDNTEEQWCTITDLDSLFNTCVDRWGDNWNLEKVTVAIRESEID